jgi:HlyD family secretion protein
VRDISFDTRTSTFPKRAIAAFSTLAVLGVGGTLAYHNWQGSISEPETNVPVSVPEPRSVTALGWIEPAGEIVQVSAPQSAEGSRVDRLLVEVGENVEAGDTLAILDNYDRRLAAVEAAQAQIEVAQAQLAQVEAGAKAGDIEAQAARFDRASAELDGQIASQRAAIARLQAQLNGERRAQAATIDRLRAELRNAERDCQRYTQLYRSGAVSEQTRDSNCLAAASAQERLTEAQATLDRIVSSRQAEIAEAQATLDRTISTVQSQIAEAEASLDAIAEVRPTDVRLAEAQRSAAQASLRQAEADLELAVIRAPQAGRILDIHTRSGEAISPEGILELAHTDTMTVVAEVYESDVRKVQLGQPVTIRSDALPQNLSGTVDRIGLQVLRQSELDLDPAAHVDARVVEVRVRLDQDSSQVASQFTNLNVTVEIGVGK